MALLRGLVLQEKPVRLATTRNGGGQTCGLEPRLRAATRTRGRTRKNMTVLCAKVARPSREACVYTCLYIYVYGVCAALVRPPCARARAWSARPVGVICQESAREGAANPRPRPRAATKRRSTRPALHAWGSTAANIAGLAQSLAARPNSQRAWHHTAGCLV